MSNENETVEQVCEWLTERDLPFAASIAAVKIENPHYDAEACMIGALKNLADRILSAHNREVASKDAEIAELRECLREAAEWACGNPDEACEDCVAHGGDTPCKCEKWRKALEGGQK